MVECGSLCIRQIAFNRNEAISFYRLLRNRKMTCNEILSDAYTRTAKNAYAKDVILIQDTTDINYQNHAGRIHDIGKAGKANVLGYNMHPGLVLDIDTHSILGVSYCKIWTRNEKDEVHRRNLAIEEKESYRWIECSNESKKNLKDAKSILVVADRESDIYEEFERVPDERTDLLIRVAQNRKLKNSDKLLFEYVESTPTKGKYTLTVPKRPGKHKKRTTSMLVRYSEVDILEPHSKDIKNPRSKKLYFIDATEDKRCCPRNESPLHWRLLTTRKIESAEEAYRLIETYSLRWNIEQLFRTLKLQGLRIESSQLEDGNSLMRLGAFAIQAAVKIMQLVSVRNNEKSKSDIAIFTDFEMDTLERICAHYEGRTKKQKNPHPKGSPSYAAWIIARLGGWDGYQSQPPPGPITFLNGLLRFNTMLEAFKMAKFMCTD